MSKLNQKTYEQAMAVIHGRLSITEFSLLAKKSYRQSQRIINKVKAQGIKGVKHGNQGKIPKNKTDACLLMEIHSLLRGKYYDFNLTHFREMIEFHEGIKASKNVIHRLAVKHSLVKKAKRKTRPKVHRPRPRMPREGMLIQFDGSRHVWFGTLECDLIGGIDDATGEVVGVEFFMGETSQHCMKVMKVCWAT
jgi:hypothetical protein